MRSVEFACIFRGNVATGNLPVKPPQRGDLNQLASLILGAIHSVKIFPGQLSIGRNRGLHGFDL